MSDTSNPSKPAKPFNWEKFQANMGYTDEQVAAMIAAGEAQPMDPALKD